MEYWESVSPNEKPIGQKTLSFQMVNQIVDLSGVAYRKSILFNVAIKIEIIIFETCSIGALAILVIRCIEYIVGVK